MKQEEMDQKLELASVETILSCLTERMLKQSPDTSDEEIAETVVGCLCVAMNCLWGKMLTTLQNSMIEYVREAIIAEKKQKEEEKNDGE